MKFTVKTDKQKSMANWLINNGVIYGRCVPEQQEIFRMANEQGVLAVYHGNGEKQVCCLRNTLELNDAYCLPDDIEIIVEGDDLCDRLNDIILDAEDTDTFYELGEVIKELHERITILENNHMNRK